jgi:F-type H+-transporting ATPase subunit c
MYRRAHGLGKNKIFLIKEELIMVDVGMVKVAANIAAGVCMGIGTLGPALGLGMIGAKACESIGKKPECSGSVTTTMILALAFVESTAIYALVVSLVLLFFVGK